MEIRSDGDIILKDTITLSPDTFLGELKESLSLPNRKGIFHCSLEQVSIKMMFLEVNQSGNRSSIIRLYFPKRRLKNPFLGLFNIV